MTDQDKVKSEYNDSAVDAMATVFFMAIVISMAVFWLSGL